MFKKSTDCLIIGRVEFVKAIMSLSKPGTAADIIFDGPIAVLISVSSFG